MGDTGVEWLPEYLEKAVYERSSCEHQPLHSALQGFSANGKVEVAGSRTFQRLAFGHS